MKNIKAIIEKGVNERFAEKYDYNRLARCFDPSKSRMLDGFSSANSVEYLLHEKIGKDWPYPATNAVYVPTAVMQRALTIASGLNPLGLYKEVFDLETLEVRYNKSLFRKLGCTTFDALSKGDYAITKNAVPPNVYWLEDGAPTGVGDSDLDLTDYEILKPKIIMAHLRYSKLAQIYLGGPGIIALLASCYAQIENLVDQSIFSGTGSDGEPSGLESNSDVQTISGATFARTNATNMERLVKAEAADSDRLAWALHPEDEETLRNREVVADTGIYILQNGKIDNTPAYDSNNITKGKAWVGDFSTVIVLQWLGFEIQFNPYTEDAFVNVVVTGYYNHLARNPKVICRTTSFS